MSKESSSKESSMNNFFNSNEDNTKGHESVSKGELTQKTYGNYYDVANTITTAGASDPNDFDSAVYNRERIYVTTERNAELLNVKNDGVDTLYIIVSHGNEISMTREVPLYPGEIKTYYNVYELRLRSPTAGTSYRVTEYSLCCVFDSGSVIPAGWTEDISKKFTIGDGLVTVAAVDVTKQITEMEDADEYIIKEIGYYASGTPSVDANHSIKDTETGTVFAEGYYNERAFSMPIGNMNGLLNRPLTQKPTVTVNSGTAAAAQKWYCSIKYYFR